VPISTLVRCPQFIFLLQGGETSIIKAWHLGKHLLKDEVAFLFLMQILVLFLTLRLLSLFLMQLFVPPWPYLCSWRRCHRRLLAVDLNEARNQRPWATIPASPRSLSVSSRSDVHAEYKLIVSQERTGSVKYSHSSCVCMCRLPTSCCIQTSSRTSTYLNLWEACRYGTSCKCYNEGKQFSEIPEINCFMQPSPWKKFEE
jgi:hypothetical protein